MLGTVIHWLIKCLPLVILVLIYTKWKLNYWTRKGVLQYNPRFPLGDVKIYQPFAEEYRKMYMYFKNKGVRHGGIYMSIQPIYIPIDLNLIKQILIKDFNYFTDRGLFKVDEERDPLSGHLFLLEGSKWRNLRSKLSPTFTTSKMRMMFDTMISCTKGLEEMIGEYVLSGVAVDVKDILSRFNTDIIGSCAFGIECDTMHNPDSDFCKYMGKIFESSYRKQLRSLCLQILPKKLVNIFNLKFVDDDVEDFFMQLVAHTVENREQSNIYRKDFMHLLLQLKNRGEVSDDEMITDDCGTKRWHLSMAEISAQCFVFFIAGYETSSTTISFALFELARNTEVQEKLRLEVQEYLQKFKGVISYDSVSKMEFLDHVMKETLRKYPPLSLILRRCTIPYRIPDSDIVLEKNSLVHIPLLGLHMDPEYYPNPDKFDPDRFTKENEAKRPQFTFVPFGEGPRNCIGMRFGILQSKVGIATIINRYRLTLNSKTKVPLTMDAATLITSARDGIWIDFSEVN